MDPHEASANRQPEKNSREKGKSIKSSQESDNVLSKFTESSTRVRSIVSSTDRER